MDAPPALHLRREVLRAGWSLCGTAPGDPGADAPAPQDGWMAIAAPQPVAAALRDLERWSLAAAPTAFDAQDWWYRVRFDAPERRPGERVVLGFDGLATLADANLNGQPLLASRNMFVAHECDISDLLQPWGNELSIRFRSLDAELAQRRPRPRWRAPMLRQQQLRWIRTTLLGRTPGWSPPAAVVGPWKDVWLERRGRLHAGVTQLEAFVDGTDGVVRCRVELPQADDRGHSVVLELDDGEQAWTAALQQRDRGYAGELRLPQARLWWPHTHGEPCRYRALLKLRGAAGETSVLDLGTLGFRTIKIDTQDGEFRLQVNGVPVFCRGACWTPLDVAALRSSPDEYEAAVAQARAAGMNMLRVSGTMVYEDDAFYAACDAQGVLVWQDFMFANMDYPADDPTFLASVMLEARQQLQRLHARPCLAVLCGNSEVEQQAAMWGAPREQWRSPLFEHTLAQLCAAHAPRTPYWPSSAHGGAFPHQADVGTTSYYGVGAYLRPLDDARRAGVRFATECLAFANIPADSALARLPGGLATRVHHPAWKERSPRDLGAGWDFDDVRDHYMQAVFGVDPQRLRASDHARYLLLGRVATAEVMAATFAEWRRPASSCRGALVLYLRDLWAGAGWGLLDDQGVPKSCWYALKRVLQPLALLLTDEGGNGLVAHIVNERAEARAVRLELGAWRDGQVRVAEGGKSLALPARGALSLPVAELLPQFVDLSYAYRFGPLPCDAVVLTLRDGGGAPLAQAFHFPGGLPAQPHTDAGLHARATMLDERTAQLVVSTERLAQAVHFDLPGFVADDEYFHLAPGGEACVTLRCRGPATLAGSVHALNSTGVATVKADGGAARQKGSAR